jgi:hypothetical protein
MKTIVSQDEATKGNDTACTVKIQRFTVNNSGAGCCVVDSETGRFSAFYQHESDAVEIARQMNLFADPSALAAWQAMPAKMLDQPYNAGHPDSHCSARNGRKHKFFEVRREQVRRGVFRCLSKCRDCGGEHSYLLDYTVTAGIF